MNVSAPIALVTLSTGVWLLVSGCDGSNQAAPNGPTDCNFTEADLIGSWSFPFEGDGEQVIGLIPPNDSREFEFVRNGNQRTYSEWLHHRPAGNGLWVFSDCEIEIKGTGFVEHFRLEGDGLPVLIDNSGTLSAQRSLQ